MYHNCKTTCMVYPLALLALRTVNIHLQPCNYRTLFHNSKTTRSVYPSALPRQRLKLSLYQSHATLHAEIYKPTLKTLTDSSNVSESWKETTRKSKENSSANAVKWRQSAICVDWGSPCPLRTFAPDQCIPASAIMQLRRNVYEYSTKKLRPSFPYAN